MSEHEGGMNEGWMTRFRHSRLDERLAAVAECTSSGFDAFPYLIEALGDPEWRVRKSAVEGVLGMGFRPEMVVNLIGALTSADNAALRNSAAEVLVRFGSTAVPSLLASVSSSGADIQKFLMDILGEIGDRRSTPALIGLLQQPDENVAMAAVEALGKLHDVRALDPLIAVLRQDRPILQFSAVKALQELGDGRAVEPLIACLGRKTLERAVLEALGHIGDLRSLDALTHALRWGAAKVRHTALRALVELHHRMTSDTKTKIICRLREIYESEVRRFILDALQSDDAAVKRHAITFLGWMGDVQAIGPMIAAYDEGVKEEMVAAFVRMQREGIPKLLGVVPSVPEGLREGIARALGEIGDRKAVHGLAALASDSNGHVRQSAAIALGQLADPMGVKPLLELLDDPYPNVREAAYRALTKLNGTVLVRRLLELLENPKATLRCYAAKLLGTFHIMEARERLTLNMKDPDPIVRRTALAALDSLGGEMGDVVQVALSDDDPSVRLEAVRILAVRPGLDAGTLLRPLLSDPDMWIRAEAIRLLGQRVGPSVADIISPALRDAIGLIQIAACETLAKLKAQSSRQGIMALLASADLDVRQAAIVALGELGGTEVAGRVTPLLDDPHWGIRAAAAVALGRVQASAAVGRLRDLAQHDPDQLVRESAHFALDQLAVGWEQAS
ncbi:MAG: HEAT repeat domain-containing protein [Nitrospiria bacterium]